VKGIEHEAMTGRQALAWNHWATAHKSSDGLLALNRRIRRFIFLLPGAELGKLL
jgi:hypothetical protein